MAINIVAYMKYNSVAKGMPVANMWCPHTTNDKSAMAAVA